MIRASADGVVCVYFALDGEMDEPNEWKVQGKRKVGKFFSNCFAFSHKATCKSNYKSK